MTDDRHQAGEVRHPPCGECTHYRVTWDRGAPHGCSAFGFKTPRQPSRVVYESSGAVCQLFLRPAQDRGPGAS